MFRFAADFKEDTLSQVEARLHEILHLITVHDYQQGEGWMLFKGRKQKASPSGPRHYTVQVTVIQLVPDAELDLEDQHDGCPDGLIEQYDITAYSQEMAIEDALDKFHDSWAIKCLDDYEIETKIVKPRK